MKKMFTIMLMLLALPCLLWAQGVTTGAMNGFVTDQGKPLAGARVTAVHLPSGTKYGAITRSNGLFNIPAVRVGGPYSVSVTSVGYKTQERTGFMIELSQNLRVDFAVVGEAVQLEAVQVSAERNAVFSASRTGAAQNVVKEQIERFPTITRSFQDFTKFSPFVNNNSVAGRNGKYNNIQIDGAQYNDLFGLGTSGAPGGQANSNPISLDAIQEYQLVIAPYDVRRGRFSGGGINAITRSGTNKVEGSLYFFGRTQEFVGGFNDISTASTATVGVFNETTTPRPFDKFNEIQTGFRVGGPIIEDKLFFFVNGERTYRSQPFQQIAISQRDAATATALTNAAAQVENKLRSFGYDPGNTADYTAERPGWRIFGRLDWNINENHRLTLRHNFVDAFDDIVTSGFGTIAFSNRNYRFYTNQNSTVMQLNSTFGGEFANEAIIGYTRIRDRRAFLGAEFPTVSVRNSVANTPVNIDAGPENFSVANELDQDIFEITNNLTYFAGDHILTLGMQNEIVSFRNLFIRNLYGNYTFNSLQDFLNGKASNLQFDFARQGFDPKFAAKFTAAQLGFYIQDEWTVNPQLKITLGLRVDFPIYPDNPSYNITADTIKYVATASKAGQAFGVRTDQMPGSVPHFAPRLGFNYDVSGDRTTQIRGGIGLFTGRVPFVWVSNQYSNTGVEFARVNYTPRAPDTLAFQSKLNPFDPTFARSIGNVTELNVMSSDFRMPQLLRANFAVDHQLPYGIVATLEGIYSKSINEIFYSNLNIGPTGQKWGAVPGIDQRSLYGTYSGQNTVPTAQVGNFNSGPFNNVVYLTNTSLGYSYQIAAQLQKSFDNGLFASLAYTLSRSYDQNSGTSSQAVSQWGFNYTPNNPNDAPLSPSSFDRPHRLIASVSYRLEYLDVAATTISLFYEGSSGTPFSYTYGGDLNADGRTNDLLYIPKDKNDVLLVNRVGNVISKASNFSYEQLDWFINNDPYLSTIRGKVAERNASRLPWSDQVDLRIAQEIKLPTGKVEITCDILNFMNLLNSNWGRVPNSIFNYNLLSFQGATSQAQATSFGVPLGTPMFTYDSNRRNPVNYTSFASRWQMQLGVRYTF